jgi:ankyrin repeat protein
MLIERLGADINKQDENGNTLLHCACESGKHTLIQFCFENNADYDLRNSKGFTPLRVCLGSEQTYEFVHNLIRARRDEP